MRLEFYEGKESERDFLVQIAEYLLHIKTDKKIRIPAGDGHAEDILTYCWVDYFSTAEVVESLTAFHSYGCDLVENGQNKILIPKLLEVLPKIRVALVRACSYFEQTQEDGTWGSHIDTIKVVTAYVMTRRLLPQRSNADSYLGIDNVLVPEIHTTFKALRWVCDEKQIFSDGSFMHTMFLTIFYAQALIEVHNSWDAAKERIDKLYDNVVWASPMRTTPERSKRLAESMQKIRILEDLSVARKSLVTLKKWIWTSLMTVSGICVFLFFGFTSGAIKANQTVSLSLPSVGDFFQYLGVAVAIYLAVLALIWKRLLRGILKGSAAYDLKD